MKTNPVSESDVQRQLHGVLLLDKPLGMSSNRALQRVKRLYRATKAGHTGSLDPLATGMLPICFGEATKLTQYMLAADKRYRVTAILGQATATGDTEGDVVAELPVPELSAARVDRVLESFRGELEQIPPMYSALKQAGRRLYELARDGIEVERKPRTVTIDSLQLLHLEGAELALEVLCSKGTYVRTLVEDIAIELGTVGHVSALRRIGVGIFDDAPMAPLDVLEQRGRGPAAEIDEFLLPVDSGIADWRQLAVDSAAAGRLICGQSVVVPSDTPRGLVRLYSAHKFFGIGEVHGIGQLAPKRIFPSLGAWC